MCAQKTNSVGFTNLRCCFVMGLLYLRNKKREKMLKRVGSGRDGCRKYFGVDESQYETVIYKSRKFGENTGLCKSVV